MGLARKLTSQFRKPDGLLGHIVVFFMTKMTSKQNQWVLSLSRIRKEDHVLEIGFGPGKTIGALSELARDGKVVGMDFSESMVKKAQKYNKTSIDRGLVELICCDVRSIPYDTASFDKVIGLNVMYFWKNPLENLTEIKRVLKPGGSAFLYISSADATASFERKCEKGTFTSYSKDEGLQLFQEAGFNRATCYEMDLGIEQGKGLCFVGYES